MLRLVFESPHLLAFEKPPGLPSAPLPEHSDQDSALQRALSQFPELRKVRGLRPHEPAILHRLDTGTSGVLLFARTDAAFAQMRALWPQYRKTYRAWVTPQIPQAKSLLRHLPQTLRANLGHSAKSSKRMLAQRADLSDEAFFQRIRGKPLAAQTDLLKIHTQNGSDYDLEILIHSAVMHQIRVHCASVGLPLVGDAVYGPESQRLQWKSDPTALQLHAWKVTLLDGTVIESPLGRGLWTKL